jgi:glycosyltransferase involved in cell wall biosynthesis
MKNPRLIVIGNMLGRNPGYVTTQGQILADLFAQEGFAVVSASSKVNRVYRMIDVIATLFRNRTRTDVLIVEVYSGLNIVMSETVGLLGRLLGLRMIFVLHGGNLHSFAERHPRLTRRVVSRASLLVAPSPFLARIFREQGLDVRVVRNVVDLEGYPFRLRQTVAPKMIWMRAFHKIYNPEMAVEVLRLVRGRYPQTTLVMGGLDKGLEAEVRQLAEDLGLREAIRFPGFLDQDAKICEFSDADIFLNTNRIDNMPVAVIEAWAMGLPVIATCVGGIPDMITTGQNGLLVPDGDSKGMAAAVISLLENAELAERFSKNGRLLAERSSWEAVRADWEKLFDEIMQPREKALHVSAPRRVSNT